MVLPRRILVPTDFTDASEAALDYAVELGRRLGAPITLLHVFRPPTVDLPTGMIVAAADATDHLLRAAEEVLLDSAKRRQGQGATIEVAVEVGAPWRAIVEFAAKMDTPLIVMGTQGRTGVSRALLGSVAEKVVRMALCPVLTISGASMAA